MPELIPEGVYADKIKYEWSGNWNVGQFEEGTARLATMLDNGALWVTESVEMHSIVHNRKRFNKEFQTFKVSLRLALFL